MSKKTKKTNEEDDDGIFTEYFKYTKENREKYGEKMIVLMQVGSFYEIYAVKDQTSGFVSESLIVEVGELCQLTVIQKTISYGANGKIMMAGIPLQQLDKYLNKLLECGFVVPLYLQDKDGKKGNKRIPHELIQVYSPGTILSYDTDTSSQITNNMMCIWIEICKSIKNVNSGCVSKTKDTMVIGVSVINNFTGKSYLFEYSVPFLMIPSTFDELERCVSVFLPSELLLLSPFDEKTIQKIKQFARISSSSVHTFDTRNVDDKKIINCSSQKYIKEIISSLFNPETYSLCSEFHQNMLASQAFCFMTNFIQEHNRELVRKISIPDFNNSSDNVILANHTLMQLNIIDDQSIDGKNSGQFSSVLSLLNKCCSAMGKRKFRHQLTSPSFNEEWLNGEYHMISSMLSENNYCLITPFRKQIRQIYDIEKICRQLVVRKIYPSSVANLYKSIEIVEQLNTCLFELPEISNYLCDDFLEETEDGNVYMKKSCDSVISFLNQYFYIDLCSVISSTTTFDVNIIKPGFSDELDEKIRLLNNANEVFGKLHEFLNGVVQKQEKSSESEYVKIPDKSTRSLQITTKRSEILKKIISTRAVSGEQLSDPIKIMLSGTESVSFSMNDIKFTKISSSSTIMNISFPLLDKTCSDITELHDKIDKLIAKVYLEILKKLEDTFFETIENIASYVSKIDVLQAKVFSAKEYNYCRPEIVTESSKSFVDSVDLRHCLIEHLQQNELYVPNDISLGSDNKDNVDGLMLYGTNAVGKTSLIRALGVSIIMAQSGMFVPCSQFRYKPYTAIYSRILANDNLFKGLSTFAVEMSELRIILKMADQNSLILGDELCSGTETESALSIFIAGLMELHNKKSSFIFATHFHEIVDYEEIVGMKNLKMKHLSVIYDRENECLIYDRKLKDGSGPKTYGLEVCKSLYLGDDFLEKAYAIRNKYYPETKGMLSDSPSRYNSGKIRGVCEKCKNKPAQETHHMQEQKHANDNGFIGSFHKNHVANLLSLCQDCHKAEHHSDEPSIKKRTKTTKGFVLTEGGAVGSL